MSFSGWPEEALDFYDGLAADNSKTYWTAHRHLYEAAVLGPMTELVEELAPEFGEAKIFRPYRDIRFSKDKAPYKTHTGGRWPATRPAPSWRMLSPPSKSTRSASAGVTC